MSLLSNRTLIIDSFPDAAFRHLEEDAIACIDVMLAGTALVTSVAQGRQTFVAASEEQARGLSARLPHACLAGPGEDAPYPGFELTDSPIAVLGQPAARPLVLFSPPCTELITNAASCRNVLVASFRNLTATASELATYRSVAILGAGCRAEFSCEDQMAAAWIGLRLVRKGFEPRDRRTAGLIDRWAEIEPALAAWGNSADGLRRAGRAEDLDFVLGHVDDVDIACSCRAGEVVPAPARVLRGAPPAHRERGAPVLAAGSGAGGARVV